ncbi:exodeoxyribonuclease VII large subunit, partial [Porphyromonas sp.]|uniref:exodeoxyribonuclease VII large subunit n=1 Tax=Porphyromonas sp. TaxID=1924944 RepID=UPI001CB31A28
MQQQATTVRSFSLTELLGSVRRCLEHSFPDRYWVRAEVSDLRRAGSQGHGYLELLEKGEEGDVVAKVRATIWSSTYTLIEQRFERSGVGRLSSGMSILALVGIAFHPQYGLSLNIIDIDPSYSLGEIARLRLETIQRLKRNGLFTMN